MLVATLTISLISLTLIKSTVGEPVPTAVLTLSPKNPILNTRVKIECKLDYAVATRLYITPQKKGKNMEPIGWVIASNTIKNKEQWKKKEELKISTDLVKRTLTLSFIAKSSDSLTFHCLTFIIEPGVFYQAFDELTVRSPPRVISLGVVPKTVDGKLVEQVISGESRQVKCSVMKGSDSKSDHKMEFTAPGNGTAKYSILRVTSGVNATVDYVLNRVFNFKDNGRTSFCSATNDAGTSSKRFTLNITYGPRNTELSVSKGANISVGDEISCKSDGNPIPDVRITVSNYNEKDASWASKGATGAGSSYLFIPHKASLGRYTISCNASNALKSEVVKAIAINVVAARVTVKTNEAASFASAGVVGGIILGVLVLVILFAIICFVVQRRQHESVKQESSRNEYLPVSTKPSEQQGAAELEKDTGPYDIDAHDNKSGGQGGAHPGDRNQQATDLFVPSSGGSNGKQQFLERGDESIDDETALNEQPLNYASLEFDETPRSRIPIVFKDSEKVEYSEIMSTPNYNNSYDDEHYYENVRHNVV